MRVIVFFDLPVVTPEQRHDYRVFHKFLIRNGFVMMQESVYSKIALNPTVAEAIMENVRKHKAPKGIIQMLVLTERQFDNIELVVGEGQHTIVDTDERLIII